MGVSLYLGVESILLTAVIGGVSYAISYVIGKFVVRKGKSNIILAVVPFSGGLVASYFGINLLMFLITGKGTTGLNVYLHLLPSILIAALYTRQQMRKYNHSNKEDLPQ